VCRIPLSLVLQKHKQKHEHSQQASTIELDDICDEFNFVAPNDPDLDALSMIEQSLKDFSDIDIMGTRFTITAELSNGSTLMLLTSLSGASILHFP
jgi:hypothetical protein